MKVLSAGLTDPGLVRKNNEDAFRVDETAGLLVVADGMGGHAAGEVASRMAVDVVHQQVLQGLKTGKIPALGNFSKDLSDRAHLLASSLVFANDMIYAVSQDSPEKRGMGTTIVAVLLNGSKFAVAHVGDSRLYVFRNGNLTQITQDHSLVAEQVAKGLLTSEQAEKSEIKNVLTRALGIGPEVEVDVNEADLFPGDVVLLCTDGLNKMAEDSTIREELAKLSDPEKICDNLVRMAVDRGGRDNVTVVAAVALRSGLKERVSGFFKKKK